jgi:thioredoxin reductase
MTVANAVVDAERGGFAGRPDPAVTSLTGLFVAGDWVGAEGMLADASFASAKRAAQLAKECVKNKL